MTIKKYLIIVIITSLTIWTGYLIYPSYIEFKTTQRELHKIEQELLKQQQHNEILRERIHKLKTDRFAIERVAREKFGWSREGEKIYDFSDSRK